MNKNVLLLISLIALFSCDKDIDRRVSATKVAFISDVHLQNIFADLNNSNFKGAINPKDGKHVLARTMYSQILSTRLFNENYFAFKAALNQLINEEVKYIVIPGDFSDNGQPVNINAFKDIITKYEKDHGVRFFLTTGNHDPNRPFDKTSEIIDMLNSDGERQLITNEITDWIIERCDIDSVALYDKIIEYGYENIINTFETQGFYPQERDLYWSSPFASYEYENYDYQLALKESKFSNRKYSVKGSKIMPDVSYVVEPEEGVWFLSIDGNIYLPRKEEASENPLEYYGAGSGYNNVFEHKAHLITWIKEVSQEAQRLNKRLIVFSHYPVVDFNDNIKAHLPEVFKKGFSSNREPVKKVSQMFVDAGIKVHFGGHMHINDTGIYTDSSGNKLYNIQVPSLAAYPPAIKILNYESDSIMEITTKVISDVKDFDYLFELYKKEHKYLLEHKPERAWDSKILEAKNYKEYTLIHLELLIKNRLVKSLPSFFVDNLKANSLYDFLKMSLSSDCNKGQSVCTERVINTILTNTGLSSDELHKISGIDVLIDCFKLRNGGSLALDDIDAKRVAIYKTIAKEYNATDPKKIDELAIKMLFNMINVFIDEEESVAFRIDIKNNHLFKMRNYKY